jgi:hypothetical protein
MSAPKCAACGGDWPMCNLYYLTKGQQPIPKFARAMKDRMGRANGALGIVARRGKQDEGGLAV